MFTVVCSENFVPNITGVSFCPQFNHQIPLDYLNLRLKKKKINLYTSLASDDFYNPIFHDVTKHSR